MSDVHEAEQIVAPTTPKHEEEHVDFTLKEDGSDDEWILFDGSGYKSKLPYNPEWPVVERLVYPVPPTPQYAIAEQCKDHYNSVMSQKDAPGVCLVAGSNSLIGRRLVSMLLQRGAKSVIALDRDHVTDEILAEHKAIVSDPTAIEYVEGSIDDIELITRYSQGVDAIFNAAACVGPHHSKEAYFATNHQSLNNLLEAARIHQVKALVHVSTPLTRIHPEDDDIVNKRVDELPELLSFEYKDDYVYSRARGEKLILDANSEEVATIVISPHHVYSPYDKVFLPSFVNSANDGDLRIMGKGDNLTSITHVDNCCHALILAAANLQEHGFNSPVAGKTHFVSDGGAHYLWGVIDDIIVRSGLPSLKTKVRAPSWIISPVSHVFALFDKHSKLNPSTVHMMTRNRYFNIEPTIEELGYYPIRAFHEAWFEVCEAILTRLGHPCYTTRFYFEGVQFEGMRAEIAKAEKAERDELVRLRKEEADAREEERKRAEAEKQQQAGDDHDHDDVDVAPPVDAAVDDIDPQPDEDQQPSHEHEEVEEDQAVEPVEELPPAPVNTPSPQQEAPVEAAASEDVPVGETEPEVVDNELELDSRLDAVVDTPVVQ